MPAQPGAVNDSPVHAAGEEALAIAEGLARAEVERRARQAFESANEIFSELVEIDAAFSRAAWAPLPAAGGS